MIGIASDAAADVGTRAIAVPPEVNAPAMTPAATAAEADTRVIAGPMEGNAPPGAFSPPPPAVGPRTGQHGGGNGERLIASARALYVCRLADCSGPTMPNSGSTVVAPPLAAPFTTPDVGAPALAQDEATGIRPEDWRLGGGGAIVVPGAGAPGMPPLLVAQIFGQLAPAAIVSSVVHLLLACPVFGQLGVHCLPADPNGYAEVACIASGTEGDAPVILAHDLNGQQAQALLHGLEAANCTAQVFFVALCLPGTTDGDDAATVAALAIRQWGHGSYRERMA